MGPRRAVTANRGLPELIDRADRICAALDLLPYTPAIRARRRTGRGSSDVAPHRAGAVVVWL
jgi:hypothetical protein